MRGADQPRAAAWRDADPGARLNRQRPWRSPTRQNLQGDDAELRALRAPDHGREFELEPRSTTVAAQAVDGLRGDRAQLLFADVDSVRRLLGLPAIGPALRLRWADRQDLRIQNLHTCSQAELAEVTVLQRLPVTSRAPIHHAAGLRHCAPGPKPVRPIPAAPPSF
jgi:hypothetical protein